MSNQSFGSGLYGQTNSAGQGISMTPATLRAEIVDPVLRSLLASSSTPPDQTTTQGLMNWAGSQGRSNRAIMPTIPGLTLPANIQQILQQPTLAQVAKGLGGPPVDQNTGQFAQPSGQVAQAPASQNAAPAGPAPAGPAPTDFVSQIVAKAVASVLSQSAGGETGPSGGGSGGGPGSPGDVPGGSASGGAGGGGGNTGGGPASGGGGGSASSGAAEFTP